MLRTALIACIIAAWLSWFWLIWSIVKHDMPPRQFILLATNATALIICGMAFAWSFL